jgi:hypothetical protein
MEPFKKPLKFFQLLLFALLLSVQLFRHLREFVQVHILSPSIRILVCLFIKIGQNTPQLCWGVNGIPSPLGGEKV